MSAFCLMKRPNSEGVQDDYASVQNKVISGTSGGRFVFNKNKNVLSIDGETVVTSTYASFSCSYNAFVGSLNNGGSAMTNAPVTARLYSVTIYDNGTLIRDFMPYRRRIDGAVGMLDLVNEVFYESASGVAFLAPGELPAGYTRLEYIESTSGQYIDTGFVPNQDTRLVMQAYLPVNGNNQFIYGARTGEFSNTFAFNSYRTRYRMHYCDGHSDFSESLSFSEPFEIDHNKETVTINGSYAVSRTYSEFTCPSNLVLFAVNNSSGTAATFATAKVYSCDVYDNDTLVRDFIPAKDSGGEAGLFDMVTMSFYKDAAGVGFVAGPVAA